MSRRKNSKRRAARRERKVAHAEAMRAFDERYPHRGPSPSIMMLAALDASGRRDLALKQWRAARDPLNFDVLFERKRAELREIYKRNGVWRHGVEALDHSGWAPREPWTEAQDRVEE